MKYVNTPQKLGSCSISELQLALIKIGVAFKVRTYIHMISQRDLEDCQIE